MKKQHNPWMAGQVSRLLIFPSVILLSLAITVLWLSNGEFSRYSYWNIQAEWFTTLNARLSSWPVFWTNVTELGDALVLLPLLSFLIFRHPRMWAALFGAIPLGVLLSIGGKHLAAIPRPAGVLDPGTFVILGQTLKSHTSFPSGHTITVFACMTVILLTLIPSPKGWRQYTLLVAGFAVAGLMALSRVAVGAHWPFDIIAGAALGYLAGLSGILLTHRYQRWWHWLEAEQYNVVFGLIMLLWSIGLAKEASNLHGNAAITILAASSLGLISSLCLFKRCINPRLEVIPLQQ